LGYLYEPFKLNPSNELDNPIELTTMHSAKFIIHVIMIYGHFNKLEPKCCVVMSFWRLVIWISYASLWIFFVRCLVKDIL